MSSSAREHDPTSTKIRSHKGAHEQQSMYHDNINDQHLRTHAAQVHSMHQGTESDQCSCKHKHMLACTKIEATCTQDFDVYCMRCRHFLPLQQDTVSMTSFCTVLMLSGNSELALALQSLIDVGIQVDVTHHQRVEIPPNCTSKNPSESHCVPRQPS